MRAREIAAPFQKPIGHWQSRLAYLRAVKMFRAEQEARAEAAELVPLVVAKKIELEAEIADLEDEAVAEHSAISAVRSALVRLRDELENV